MTAYLNPTQLRKLADLIEGLPSEFRHGEVEAEVGDDISERVAVWWDDENHVPFVCLTDLEESEKLG